VLPAIRDDGESLLVIAGYCSDQFGAAVRLKFYFFSDAEIEHGGMRAHLAEKSEARHDLVVQFDEFRFGEGVNINIDVPHGPFYPLDLNIAWESGNWQRDLMTEIQVPGPTLRDQFLGPRIAWICSR